MPDPTPKPKKVPAPSPLPTDLPPASNPSPLPSDLPLPRHRPGEPLMYDPPANGVEVFPISDPDRTHIQ